MHLIGVAVMRQPPPWEPGQGWRVLDPENNVVSSGGISYAVATLDLMAMFGVDATGVPLVGAGEQGQ